VETVLTSQLDDTNIQVVNSDLCNHQQHMHVARATSSKSAATNERLIADEEGG